MLYIYIHITCLRLSWLPQPCCMPLAESSAPGLAVRICYPSVPLLIPCVPCPQNPKKLRFPASQCTLPERKHVDSPWSRTWRETQKGHQRIGWETTYFIFPRFSRKKINWTPDDAIPNLNWLGAATRWDPLVCGSVHITCLTYELIRGISYTGWWFGTCCFFRPNSWDDDPIWLIIFMGVETTNQL